MWTANGQKAPGTSSNEGQGLIVDWSHGTISPPPKGLPLYEVFCYADFRNQGEKQVYVVSYEYDPSTRHGYVYLPGKGDQWWGLNVSSICRGIEGSWFSAWSEWDDVARPFIERATVTASKPPDA
jgi:hypothetical protein